MIQLLTAPETVAFTAALVLMLAIGVVEAIGLGSSAIDLDLDLADGGGGDGLLGWLGIGQVPLLVLLVAFLAAFGIVGLAGQRIALALGGGLLPAVVAVPGASVLALPASALLARGLARIMPRDETTAFDVDRLVGLTGTLTVGRATAGSPARARVIDPHGQAHHVAVEPAGAGELREGDTVLLVARHGHGFHAIVHDSPRYPWSPE